MKSINNCIRESRIILLAIFFCSASINLCAQHTNNVTIHSHNDYRRTVPFYEAYAKKVNSIEADVYAINGQKQLLVAHDREELPTAPTLLETYILPLVKVYKQNKGQAWGDSNQKLHLLIDLKTAPEKTMKLLVQELSAYPEVFDDQVNPNAVQVIVSGNMPKPKDFDKYPTYISFDGRSKTNYTEAQLKRIALISDDFGNYSRWNGKGLIIASERIKLEALIAHAHALGKPIRFWGTPDYITAWNTFYRMGVDFINTDKPDLCANFFNDFDKKNFVISSQNTQMKANAAKTDRLDKVTSNFKGFDSKSQHLSKSIELYQPTFKNDGTNGHVKNVILLIGDGMGLAQVSAASTVNNGLTMLNLKHIGLQKTSAKDAYTTDSAGAGSALATGESTNNRYISMGEDGKIHPTMCELLSADNFACGVVTLGNIADATPAVYYGHSMERNNSDEITNWLLQGSLTLLCGSGENVLTDRKDKRNLSKELEKQYNIIHSIDEINKVNGKTICVDERMANASSESTLSLLADATNEAIKKLNNANDKGFFLMVEGAKIDYAGHANSLPSSIVETLSFDLAVGEALKFADTNGETLIIVTGDHETGGLTLVDGDNSTGLITACYMTDDHTPIMLPVYAYGPQSTAFLGVYQNTEIFKKIMQSLKK